MSFYKDTYTHIKVASNPFYLKGLDEALPEKNIFPFHYFNSFNQNYYNNRKQKSKSIESLKCNNCGCDCSESGNGNYYTAYIVFESEQQIKISCSKQCLPINSMDYHDQKYGYKYPVTLPSFKKNNLDFIAVYNAVIRAHRFQLAKFINSKITWSNLWNCGFSEYSGAANNKLQYTLTTTKLVYSTNFKNSKTLTKSDIVQIVNYILNNQNEVQLTLF